MAKAVAVAWFPRSYIQLFETNISLGKVDLKLKDVEYPGNTVSFTIAGYKGYSDIRFVQDGSGLHYFIVDLPDVGVEAASEGYMKDMQVMLLEKILKACHSVTYKQIVADTMPLDFHLLVLTKGEVKTDGFEVVDVGDMRVAYKPQDYYLSGTVTYVLGTDDLSLLKVLLFHAYLEVGFDFLYNMMKAMIRLYHEADTVYRELGTAKEQKVIGQQVDVLGDIVEECNSRHGKMSHVILNIRLKEREYGAEAFNQRGKALAEALKLDEGFAQLKADGDYMEVLWGETMNKKIEGIISMLKLRMGAREEKKGWF